MQFRTLYMGQKPDPIRLETPLAPQEVRVLGCLMEKEILTPDVYPLTLNSLLNACNQKTSRDPVVAYDDDTVDAVLEMLRGKGLVSRLSGPEHRVPKYQQLATSALVLSRAENAALCVLLLRGAQTPGEINQRSGRLYEFASLNEVEETLEHLATREPQPLVVRLERQAGTKEARYAHLLSGTPVLENVGAPAASGRVESSRAESREDRITALEAEVSSLKKEVADLRGEWEAFRRQFE